VATGPVLGLARPPPIRDFLDDLAWHARRIDDVRLRSLKFLVDSLHFKTNRQEMHIREKSGVHEARRGRL
jgi:hypothetical protein